MKTHLIKHGHPQNQSSFKKQYLIHICPINLIFDRPNKLGNPNKLNGFNANKSEIDPSKVHNTDKGFMLFAKQTSKVKGGKPAYEKVP